MTIPFYEEVLKESFNLVNKDSHLFYDKNNYATKALYFTPDGKLYYANNHNGGQFHEDYRKCDFLIYLNRMGISYPFSSLEKPSEYSLVEDKINIMRRQQANILAEMKENLKAADITLLTAREYVNYNFGINKFGVDAIDYGTFDTEKNIFNQSMINVIQGILSAKYYVYNFFVKLCELSPDPKETLESAKKLLRSNHYEFDNIIQHGFGFETVVKDIFVDTNFIKDMLVLAMGFDKIETQLSKTITTANPKNIHQRFYYYELMGFDIKVVPRLIINHQTNCFKWDSKDWIQYGEERELEEQIQLIKKLPASEIKKYFM